MKKRITFLVKIHFIYQGISGKLKKDKKGTFNSEKVHRKGYCANKGSHVVRAIARYPYNHMYRMQSSCLSCFVDTL